MKLRTSDKWQNKKKRERNADILNNKRDTCRSIRHNFVFSFSAGKTNGDEMSGFLVIKKIIPKLNDQLIQVFDNTQKNR